MSEFIWLSLEVEDIWYYYGIPIAAYFSGEISGYIFPSK